MNIDIQYNMLKFLCEAKKEREKRSIIKSEIKIQKKRKKTLGRDCKTQEFHHT